MELSVWTTARNSLNIGRSAACALLAAFDKLIDRNSQVVLGLHQRLRITGRSAFFPKLPLYKFMLNLR